MIKPGLLAVLTPVVVGFGFKYVTMAAATARPPRWHWAACSRA